jgi:hypothetical protein
MNVTAATASMVAKIHHHQQPSNAIIHRNLYTPTPNVAPPPATVASI